MCIYIHTPGYRAASASSLLLQLRRCAGFQNVCDGKNDLQFAAAAALSIYLVAAPQEDDDDDGIIGSSLAAE